MPPCIVPPCDVILIVIWYINTIVVQYNIQQVMLNVVVAARRRILPSLLITPPPAMLARCTNSFVLLRSVSSSSSTTSPAIFERRRSKGNANATTTAEITMIRENKKRVTSTHDASSNGGGGGVRLSALLSRHLGLSRRQAERMVLTERVTLFGKVVTLPSFELQHSSANNYTNNTHAMKVDGKLITGIDDTIQLINKEEILRRGSVGPELTTAAATTNADEATTSTSAIRNAGVESEQPNIRIWLANKLSGELVTEDDPVGRPSLLERLSRGGVGKSNNNNNKKQQSQSSPIHLKPVGRLDMMTEGLIIITNDGRYARELELPNNLFHRTYRARVHGRLTEGKLRAMRNGVTVRVDDAASTNNSNDTSLKVGKSGSGSSRKSGIDKPSGEVVQTGRLMRYKGIKVAIERKNLNSSSRGRSGSDSGGGRGTNTWLRITCTEGKNRQLRRILESMGLDVTRLIRISYGDYDLNTIPPGMAIEVPYKQLAEMKKKGPLFANSDGKRRMKKKTESDTDEDVSSSKVEWINYS